MDGAGLWSENLQRVATTMRERGLASVAGYVLFAGSPPAVVAGITAVAAGAILAMLADTMIPEAFDEARDFAGLITVAGFLAAFSLSKMGGG